MGGQPTAGSSVPTIRSIPLELQFRLPDFLFVFAVLPEGCKNKFIAFLRTTAKVLPATSRNVGNASWRP